MQTGPMNRVARGVALGALLVAAAACGARDATRRLLVGENAAATADSLARLRTEVEYLRAASAERDTLLQQVRETQDFIDSVDTDLERLAGPDSLSTPRVSSETLDTGLSTRELMRQRLQAVAERIARNDREAHERAARIRVLAGRTRALETQVAGLDSAVARFRGIVRGQQEQIASLVARVDTLERANAQLLAERGALTDSVQRLVAQADSVFVIAASRAELLRAGVVTEAGGTRLPIFGRVSAAIVPARVQRAEAFTVLDRRRDVEIRLPNDARAYRIVSSHDPAWLAPSQPGNPVVRGVLRIGDPAKFWAGSRFLVLVEE